MKYLNFDGIDSVAIFGSAIRVDYDGLSDKDILLISDDSQLLKRKTGKFNLLGWSCANYSWDKFTKLYEHGALFIQHIKQESIILKDKDSKLKRLLTYYEPKYNYTNDIEESKKIIGLIEKFPKSAEGRGWALDVLMIGLRNLAIMTLANEGIYAFSIDELTKFLLKLDIIKESDKSFFKKLRLYKYLYRNQMFETIPSSSEVLEITNLIDKCFNVGLNASVVNGLEFYEYALNPSLWNFNNNWYLNSRLGEAGLIVLEPKDDINCPKIREKKRYLISKIQEPRNYNWYFGNNAFNLHNEILEFAQYCILSN